MSFVIFSRSHLLFPRLPHHPRAPSNCPASRHHDHQDGDDVDAQNGDDQDGDAHDALDGDSTFPPVS